MPVSRHPAHVLHIPADYQSQSIQAPLGIRSGPYSGFCLITVNPEDVAVIVVNVYDVMHRVIFSVYQFHCY